MNKPALSEFLALIKQSLEKDCFISMALDDYKGQDKELKKILIRPILIKRQKHLSFTYRYKTRDIVKNYVFGESIKQIEINISSGFASTKLCTVDFDVAYPSLKQSPPSQKKDDDLSHDRTKKRHIETNGKSYLYDLKITDSHGSVLKSSQDKFRQIDKYIEILGGLIQGLDKNNIKKIADMGSGKGYLTFALCDYLKEKLAITPKIIGVEYRADMVDLCNEIAKKAQFTNLSFLKGSIDGFDAGGINVFIALHACDTATDDAIYKGIAAGADLIVVVPCCHKQIRKEMESHIEKNGLYHMLRHGIFLERHAEMVTDSLRALILEYHGYAVKVFEFISNEHTGKNIMIVATKGKISSVRQSAINAQIKDIKYENTIAHHALDRAMAL